MLHTSTYLYLTLICLISMQVMVERFPYSKCKYLLDMLVLETAIRIVVALVTPAASITPWDNVIESIE